MPQSCPRCSRPNGDAATRCLYCGAALEPPPAPESDGAAELPRWPESYCVLVTGPIPSSQRAAFEQLAGRPASWLDTGLPLPVRTFPAMAEAMELHALLTDAAIPSTVVEDARLGETGPMLHARRAAWNGMQIVFSAADERRTGLDPSDLRIVVRAHVVEGGGEGAKLQARAVTGKVFPQMAGGPSRIQVLDLYPAASQPVRVVAERFDYSFLGAERSALAVDNFERLAEVLAEHAPRVPVNVAFAKVALEEARTPQELQLELHGRRLLQAILQTE